MSRKTKEEVLEEFRCGSIQDAAMAVIARKGVQDTTIQDIADEAGIAKGTVYLYFRDREELLGRTADRAYDKFVAELGPAFDADGSFAERLERVVRCQLQFFDENRELFSATMAMPEASARKKRSASFARYGQQLEKLFADAKASGEMRGDLEPADVANHYRDLVRGAIVRRIEQKPKTPREADAERILSILLRGIHSGEK